MALFKPSPEDRLRVRRHVALASLAVLVVALFMLLTLAFVGNENAAPMLSAMSVNLGIILTALTGMTAAWFHAAFRIDQSELNKPQEVSTDG